MHNLQTGLFNAIFGYLVSEAELWVDKIRMFTQRDPVLHGLFPSEMVKSLFMGGGGGGGGTQQQCIGVCLTRQNYIRTCKIRTYNVRPGSRMKTMRLYR